MSECLKMSVANSASIRQSKYLAEAQEYAVLEESSSKLPNISIIGGATSIFGTSASPLGLIGVNDSDQPNNTRTANGELSYNTTIAAKYTLFKNGSITALNKTSSQKLAESILEERKILSSTTELEVKQKTMAAYLEAVLTNKLNQLFEERLALNKLALEVAEDEYAAGKILESDLSITKQSVAALEAQFQTSKEQVVLSQISLSRLIGLPAGEITQAKLIEPELPPLPPVFLLIDAARESLGVRLNSQRISSSKYELEQIKADSGVEVSVGANYGFVTTTDFSNNRDAFSLSLTVSLPIIDFGTSQYKGLQAKANLRAAEVAETIAIEQAEEQILTLYNSYYQLLMKRDHAMSRINAIQKAINNMEKENSLSDKSSSSLLLAAKIDLSELQESLITQDAQRFSTLLSLSLYYPKILK